MNGRINDRTKGLTNGVIFCKVGVYLIKCTRSPYVSFKVFTTGCYFSDYGWHLNVLQNKLRFFCIFYFLLFLILVIDMCSEFWLSDATLLIYKVLETKYFTDWYASKTAFYRRENIRMRKTMKSNGWLCMTQSSNIWRDKISGLFMDSRTRNQTRADATIFLRAILPLARAFCYSYDLKMITRKHNQNNKRTGRKQFDWFSKRRQTRGFCLVAI